MKSMFSELTFNIMMRMVAGKRYYGDEVSDMEEARKFRKIMKEAFTYGGAANPGDFLPVLNWFGNEGGGGYMEHLESSLECINRVLLPPFCIRQKRNNSSGGGYMEYLESSLE
ncbi:Cytochrome P [Parasponia andersonii]|uniref:Cytochrome P n=1 Tax=Parasponia andersonii TaxID=3476 RepID=A0A2P5BMD1_PARAD|nr:Cytochrome P [Parasponia andersonii]